MQKTISEILYSTNTSKTKFSKDIGISKSFVIDVINGKKKCSKSMYEKIRNLSYVSEHYKSELDNAFFSNKYGKKEYDLMLQTLDELNNYDNTFLNSQKLYIRYDFMKNLFSADEVAHTINGKTEFLEIVSYLCEKSLSESNPFFISNFSFEMTELESVLFTLFRDRDYSKELYFEHIVSLNEDYSNTLNTFFKALKWGRILLITKKTSCLTEFSNQLLPYYIILNDGVLFFDDSLEHAIVYKSKNLIDYHVRLFKEKDFNTTVLSEIIYDETQCVGQTDTYANVDHLYLSFGGTPCLGPYADYDVLNNIAKDIPYKDQLIRMFIAHYANLFDMQRNEYISESSYWNFVENGKMNVITEKFVNPCSPSDRVDILKSILNANTNNESIRLFDKSKLEIPENLSFDCFESSTIITSIFDNEPCTTFVKPYCTTINVDYSEFFWFKSLINSLKNYFEENNFLLSSDANKRAFKRMIAKCEGMQNN